MIVIDKACMDKLVKYLKWENFLQTTSIELGRDLLGFFGEGKEGGKRWRIS